MRAPRAYLAGIGSSGSLLAGAAALFLVGSAIVAFQGWPQIGAGPATSDVSATPVAVTSRAARRLTAALRTTPTRGLTGRGAPAGGGPGRAGAGGSLRRGVGATSIQGPGSSGGTAGRSGGGVSSSCGGCGNHSSPGLASKLTRTISQSVYRVGSAIGNQIAGLSGSAGGQIGNVNPQAGSSVQNAGASAGSAVTGGSSSVASGISGVGGGGGH